MENGVSLVVDTHTIWTFTWRRFIMNSSNSTIQLLGSIPQVFESLLNES